MVKILNPLCIVFLLVHTGIAKDSLSQAQGEPMGVELSLDLPETFQLPAKDVQKIFREYFSDNSIPVKKNSDLKLQIKIFPPITAKVSKLSELVRAEFKVEIKLQSPKNNTPYYTFSTTCKGLEDGTSKALHLALTSMRMDSRELDMLAEKLKSLKGKRFY